MYQKAYNKNLKPVVGASYKQFAFWREENDEIGKLHSDLTRHESCKERVIIIACTFEL